LCPEVISVFSLVKFWNIFLLIFQYFRFISVLSSLRHVKVKVVKVTVFI